MTLEKVIVQSTLFGNFKVGDEFLFQYKIKENALSLEGQVVSIRKNSLGRGSHLGVIFKKGEKRDLLQKILEIFETS